MSPLRRRLSAAREELRPEPVPGNVLVVVADDLGVDQLAAYGLGSDLTPTPTIDLLAETGVTFRRAYANPICSPTRATLLTGRFSFRTGIGSLVLTDNLALPPDEITLPELLDQGLQGLYATAAIGKWHLGNASNGGPSSPNVAGFGHFAGTLFNLLGEYDYYRWPKVVDGVESLSTTYATTAQVDDALAFVEAQGDRPWFCWLAFNAPHTPFQAPPADLHSIDLPGEVPSEVRENRVFFKAMLQALDTELGRLLDSLPLPVLARTTVIFIGDNGTEETVIRRPFDPSHGKRTVYEGGIRVPLVVSGPGVAAGATCDALVQSVDVCATVADLAGIDPRAILPADRAFDGLSFRPCLAEPDRALRRPWAFAEVFQPNGPAPIQAKRAIREERYKLIRRDARGPVPADEVYDLVADPQEQVNLFGPQMPPPVAEAHEKLSVTLQELLASGG